MHSTTNDFTLQTPSLSSVGIGLRSPHVDELIEQQRAIPLIEFLIDNYLAQGGLNLNIVDQLSERYPTSFHGVNLNLGGVAPLNMEYLTALKQLVDRTHPTLLSEHLCFCHYDERYAHDLLPIPYTEEALKWIAPRIKQVQETLGRQMLIENISRYVRYHDSQCTEAEFLAALVDETGCGILLDVNNAYVNHINHQDDFQHFLASIPVKAIGEIHLAGYEEQNGLLIDTHSREVTPPVWACYEQLMELVINDRLHDRSQDRSIVDDKPEGVLPPTIIEWDNDLPPLATLLSEARKAEAIITTIQQSRFPAPHKSEKRLVQQPKGEGVARLSMRSMQSTFIAGLQSGFNEPPSEDLGLTSEDLSRLPVYANNYRQALISILQQVFGVTEKIVGRDYFRQIAAGYLAQNPSRYWDINRYGNRFSDYLKRLVEERPELDAYPYLPDLVGVEYALHQAYYAENSPEFDFTALQQIPEAQQVGVQLHLASDLYFTSTRWPLLQIIAEIRDGTLSDAWHYADELCFLLVYRERDRPKAQWISKTTYQALSLLRQPLSLGELATIKEGSAVLEQLPQLIQSGWITHFTVSSSNDQGIEVSAMDSHQPGHKREHKPRNNSSHEQDQKQIQEQIQEARG